MAQESKLSTPQAILIGSVVVAVGAFFGLRDKPAPTPASAPPASSAPSALGAAPSEPAPANAPVRPPEITPAPAAALADRSAVLKEAVAALEKQKKTLLDTCLKPSLAKQPEPKNVKFTLDYSFDAEGKQLARGIQEDRATSRSDVTQCVGAKLLPLSVTPPGQTVRLEIPLELP